jgi:hypothetical protein
MATSSVPASSAFWTPLRAVLRSASRVLASGSRANTEYSGGSARTRLRTISGWLRNERGDVPAVGIPDQVSRSEIEAPDERGKVAGVKRTAYSALAPAG